MQSSTDPLLPRHPVRLASLRTGLTPHLLRAWERRYGLVSPSRSPGGQRLYSDLDLQRLRLLRRLTERGHSIGGLAGASLADLQRVAQEEDLPVPRESSEESSTQGPEDFRSAAMGAIRRLGDEELQVILERAAVTLGVPTFLEQVAGPLLRAVGQGWIEGTVSVAQEHLASAVFRRVLGWLLGVCETREDAARLVVATPPRHVHELGAMLAADAAAAAGWHVTYLGPDLPVAEILASARQLGAAAVALSVVYPKVDAGLITDLDQLHRGLAPDTAIFIGGTAALDDRERLTSLGAHVFGSLGEFRSSLLRHRHRA